MASVTHLDTVCNSSTVVYIDIDIDIYIPKIQKCLQPLDTEHVISQSMKAPCKHGAGHKTKHAYIRTSPIYKFVNVT